MYYCFLLFNLVWLLTLIVSSLGLFSCSCQLSRDLRQLPLCYLLTENRFFSPAVLCGLFGRYLADILVTSNKV